jgi:hypothetical protein
MNISIRAIAATLAIGAGVLAAQPAMADIPGPHPGYVHALNDLRYAHWLLQFPAEYNVTAQERAAEGFIDRAYADVRRAGIDDGKDIATQMPVDANLSHRDRLVRALESLQSAHRDINGWESDPYARGPRNAADGDIDAAIAHVRASIRDRRHDHAFGY